MNENLYARLAGRFMQEPGRQFADLPDGRYYSYRDLDQVTARMAAALVEMGITPGDRVAVQVDKSIEAFALYLATVRCGGAFLPLNTAYTPAEVSYFLGDAEPGLFVCSPAKAGDLRPVAEEAGARLETLGVYTSDGDAETFGSFLAAVPEQAEFETVHRGKEDLATILYTSGTTGRSKGAMTTHENLFSNAVTLAKLWQFTRDDVLLHALPIFHTHGLFTSSNTILASGASMIWQHRFNTDDVIARLPDATSMMGVPTFYTRLLDDERFTRDLVSHMRLFVSGSAPMLTETHDRFRQRTGHTVLERYGMTETQMNTSNPYKNDLRRPGTVGFPLPDVDVKITDPDTGYAVGTGDIGMIEVRGPNVFKGYWRMPEKTAEEVRDTGFFITGDLGKIDGAGFVTIVGRSKDLIISGGYNIYPKEIETAIDDLTGVRESAVIGVPHPDFGEGVVAVVVPDGSALDEETVMAGLSNLARFKQPKKVYFTDALPRNAMGKVQKNVLRDAHAGVFARKPEGAAG